MSESYLKVLWTCGMGDACMNTERPGTHEEYSAAAACRGGLALSPLPSQPPSVTSFTEVLPIDCH
jgi:hypothetical protein